MAPSPPRALPTCRRQRGKGGKTGKGTKGGKGGGGGKSSGSQKGGGLQGDPTGWGAKGLLSQTPDGRQICFNFNCDTGCEGSCGRVHVCRRCLKTCHGAHEKDKCRTAAAAMSG